MWIFGYGSILWKVDFPIEQKLVGHIKGYKRRFYQHSTDHRGIPEKPGRVVTLLPSDNINDEVWGVAYRIPKDKIADVIAHLDFRERGGYVRKEGLFYPKDDPNNAFEIMIYVATKENKQYAGETSIEEIAQQIVSSVGPSGTNIEYFFKLIATMREIAPEVHDEHLLNLEKAIHNLTNSS